MGGWRKAGASAAPRALIVNPRLGGLLARGLLGRLDRDRAPVRARHLLHGLDIVHQLAPRCADGSHMPKLHDFDSAIDRIQHRTKKSVDRNLVSGFFQHLASGGGKRVLTWIELALWQDPRLVPWQSHDCDPRPAAFP